ncbi:metal-binding protein [Xaviernesmea oryzae]|uniref:Metal-binding protein n=1 Tax=Xaviernesmea oryzae TaxID=464029 RepID=A0A1Q9AWX5_9HYPH|nr:DUF177 domain-containing protein [Xaviernesmea oryzae]OLP59947.1 metal-binding protein [Xaviernesmea oryzae]SEK43672.1 Uncharacterized metal-binding protein YceD, DUF177 family [Xaviernesmea oryzae]
MTLKDRPPFSYRIRVGHVSHNPLEVHVEADDRERAALAKLWQVLEIHSLVADVKLTRWKRDGVKMAGRVRAKLVQACVVTLEPVEGDIDEQVEAIFVPEDSRLARIAANDSAEMFIDPDGPDMPDVFEGDEIDIGAAVAEYAALGIDPYPRKPGVAFAQAEQDEAVEDKRPNPFAVLKDWKKD